MSGTTVRPEDDFEAFMSMISDDASEKTVEEDVKDDIAEDIEDEDEGFDLNEEDEFRKAMGGEEDDEDEEESDDDEEDDYEDDESDEDLEEVVDVDFDTVITLPNGDQLSIEDLHKGYVSGGELKKKEEEFTSRQNDYESKFKDIDKLLDTAKLEADRVLEDFKGFDWQKLASEDPKEFANTKLFVEKYVARSKEIKEAQSVRAQEKVEEEKQELALKAKACVDILKTDIPEWNSDLYGEILQHAVDKLGMEADTAKNLVDPSTIKAIYRSLQLDKGTTKAKAKLKRVGSPKKVAKSGTKRVAKGKVKPVSKANTPDEEYNFFKNYIN